MTIVLDSAGNGPSGLLASWALPSVAAAGDDVLLVAAVQVHPSNTLDPPAGWTIRVEEVGSGGQRYTLCDKAVALAASPYHDTFDLVSGTSRWHALQMAFRSTAAVPGNKGSNATDYSPSPFATNPTETAPLDVTATAGQVLVGYASLTTDVGSTFSGMTWPAGWVVLEVIGGSPFVGYAEIAYKVAAGGETAVAVDYTGNLIASTVVLVAEYAIDPDPLPAPDIAILYDVYQINPPGDDIEYVATLDDSFDKGIRPVRNEPGSGALSINRYSDNATADILRPGNLVKVRVPEIHSDHIFAWFMEQGDFGLVSSNEEGGENITIGGRGALSYWDRAIWLSEAFVIPWWDVAWGTPPVGARGHVTFEAGTYRRYTVTDPDVGPITGYTNFTTAGFEAYFDRRRTYQWPSAGSKRFLVRIMAGETNAGWFVHPHQDGVTETLPSQTVGTSSSVLLSDISTDTPGAILYHLFQEGTDPGRPTQPIPLMTVDFSATLDSNGDAWSTTDALAGLTAELGETYLDTIVKLLSTGVIDVEMGPDLDMHAYNGQGRDLTGTTFGVGKVRFVKGVNVADELRRERDNNPVATFIEVVGTDNVTGRAELPDAASRVARETSATGDSADEAVLEAIGLASLNARLIKSDAVGFRIATGDDDATGLYLPGPDYSDHGDFWLGDVTTLHTGTGEQDFDQEDERVFAITIAEDDGGNLEVTPEVGSVLGEAERRLYANQSSRTVSFTSRSQFSDTEVAEPGVVIAADVEFTPAGPLVSTDVQAAIEEAAALAGGSIYYNVMDYGAVGDNTANDTAAIQAAIDAAVAAGGGTVFFPFHTYKITATLTVTGTISFLGDGGPGDDTQPTVRMATSNTTAFSCNSAYDVSFRYLRVQGPTGNSSGSGIYGNNRNIHTFGCRIQGFFYGLRIGTQAYYSKSVQTLFHDNDSANVWLEAGANNAEFYSCRMNLATYGIKSDGVHGLRVFGGSIENNTYGVYLPGGNNAVYFSGVYFETNATSDVYAGVTTADQSVTFEGCLFTTTGTTRSIDTNLVDRLTVLGCFFDPAVHATTEIRTQQATTKVLLGNNTWSGAAFSFAGPVMELDPGDTTTPAAVGDVASRGSSKYVAPISHVHALGGTVGGELTGMLPNPAVVASHSGSTHAATQAAAEATAAAALAAHVASTGSGGGDHVHVVDEVFSGDAATTVFVLANEAAPDSVMAWVAGARTPVTLGGTFNDEITFGSAPGSGTDNVSVDYAAVLA